MKTMLLIAFAGALVYLTEACGAQECTPDFCDKVKVKCPAVDCAPGEIYSLRGSGLCECCPSCIKPTDTSKCEPDVCSRVRLACRDTQISPCSPGYREIPKGAGYCGCCPACIKE